jgi:hypothetical protein
VVLEPRIWHSDPAPRMRFAGRRARTGPCVCRAGTGPRIRTGAVRATRTDATSTGCSPVRASAQDGSQLGIAGSVISRTAA